MVRRDAEITKGVSQMSAFALDTNKAFAAVFALGLSALSMAFAIIPATPAGIVA